MTGINLGSRVVSLGEHREWPFRENLRQSLAIAVSLLRPNPLQFLTFVSWGKGDGFTVDLNGCTQSDFKPMFSEINSI